MSLVLFWQTHKGERKKKTTDDTPTHRGGTRYHEGKIYEFQPDNQGGWHGYPIKGNEAPTSVLREMKGKGTITNNEYNKFIKGQ